MKLRILLVAPMVAATLHTAAPARAQNAPQPAAQSAALIARSVTLYQAGKFADAQKLLEARLQVEKGTAERAKLQNALADVHFAWGEALEKAFDYAGAIAHYQKAYQTDKTLRRSDAAADLNATGLSYRRLSQYDKALEFYQLALPLFRELKQREGEAVTLNNIGGAYHSLSQYDKALTFYNLALPLLRELKERGLEATALDNIGTAYYSLSQYDEALTFFAQALPIWREVKDQSGEAGTLCNIGQVYLALSQYARALGYFEKALPIQRQTDDRDAEGITLGSIGTAYDGLGQYREALGYFLQALPIRRQTRDKPGEAVTLDNIGRAYDNLRQPAKALTYYEQALLLTRAIHDRNDEANTLSRMGLAYNNLGQHAKALTYYEQALPIQRAVHDRNGEAATLQNIGGTYQWLGQPEKGSGYLLQALTIERQIKDRSSEAATLANLMAVAKAQKQPELAIVWGKQSVNVFQSIRADIATLSKESKDAYLQGNKDTYETLAALLIEQGRLPEAEAVNRCLRESETGGFVRAGYPSGAAVPVPLSAVEKHYLEEYAPIAGKAALVEEELAGLSAIAAAKRTPAQTARIGELRKLDEACNAQFRIFRRELTAALADPNATKDLDIVSSEEAKRALRDLEAGGAGRAAILSTVAAPDKFYVILTTAHSSEQFSVPVSKVEVERLAGKAAAALQKPGDDPRSALGALYRVVFCDGKLETALSEAHIDVALWLVNGNLRSIPLDALWDGHEYLLQKPRLNVGLTLSSLSYLGAPKVGAMLAVGTSQAHEVELKDGDVSLGHFSFKSLDGVPGEVRGIAHDEADGGTGPLDGTILLDQKPAFTAEELKAKAADCAILHMATHFNVGLDDRTSFFLLGDGNPLTVFEWEAGVPMENLELLTLSACDTGDAKFEQSETGAKIGSMGEIAQRHGAHSVIVTLWSVDDGATSQLMRDFYTRWQKNHSAGKGEALREAQRALLGAGEASTHAGESLTRQNEPLGQAGEPPTHTGEPPTPPGEALTQSGATPTGADQRSPVRERLPGEALTFTPDPKHPLAHPYYWAPFTLIGNWR